LHGRYEVAEKSRVERYYERRSNGVKQGRGLSMTATLVDYVGNSRPVLYVAFELGWSEWEK
jgi:hypothetical protein